MPVLWRLGDRVQWLKPGRCPPIKPTEEASTISGLACEPILWKGNLHAKGGTMHLLVTNPLTMDKEHGRSVRGENHCSFGRRVSTHAAQLRILPEEARARSPSKSEPHRRPAAATYFSRALASTRGRVAGYAQLPLVRSFGRKAAGQQSAAHPLRCANGPDPSLFLAALRIRFSWPPRWASKALK
jgi:hypothetical protein